MPININSRLQILSWGEAKDAVKRANPKLAEVIDRLNPGEKYRFIKVRYPFGQHILKNGCLHLPKKNGEWEHNKNKHENADVKKMLGYAKTMPIGLVLENTIELYLSEQSRIVPHATMPPGKIFALSAWGEHEVSELPHTGHVWNIMSGARSLIMLPKISDISSYKKIKREFNLSCNIPKSLSDQWSTFVGLANSEQAPSWDSELLFFSAEWFENDKDQDWQLFRYFLLSTAWQSTTYLRHQVVFDFAFSCALTEKNLKPNPYLIDTVKHIYAIGANNYPGYIVASSNKAAPVKFFQQVFNDVYELRHAPTMVHPGYYSTTDQQSPCYYSLQFPTLMAFSPKSRKASSKFDDIKEIKHTMTRIKNYFSEDKLKLSSTLVFHWVKDINYEFFHTHEDSSGEKISQTDQLSKTNRQLRHESSQFKGKAFCNTSPFLRGCVQISTNMGNKGQ